MTADWKTTLRNTALNLGLLPGRTDYTRFIILGRSRSGSNLLRGLLNDHPGVICFGELFQNPLSIAINWGLDDYPQSDKLLEHYKTDPLGFLNAQVFRKQPRHIHAVGFKIFYYHARTPAWQPVWDFLRNDPSIRVLHIKRHNVLRTHLSRVRATASNRWVNTTGESEAEQPVTLSYDELLADFEQTRQSEAEGDAFFDGHPRYEVIYEDFSQHYTTQMDAIQDFLGVPRRAVQPQTYQQAGLPLSQAISNYAELQARFQGTPWADFFED